MLVTDAYVDIETWEFMPFNLPFNMFDVQDPVTWSYDENQYVTVNLGIHE